MSNNNFFQYLQDKTNISDSKKYLIRILQRKIDDMRSSKRKNDGVIMPFLSFQFLKELYGVEILYLYSNADLEQSKYCNEKCKEFKCIRYKEIKINEVIDIQLYKDFDLEQLYNYMIHLLKISA